MGAIGKYPATVSKIGKLFQRPIIHFAGKGLAKSIEETRQQAKNSEAKLKDHKPRSGFQRNQIENDDFMNQISLGFFEIFHAAYKPFIKFGIRALPRLVENHDIKKHLPLVKTIHEVVTSADNPDWDKVQEKVKESLVILAGELAQYDGGVNDLLKGIISLGKVKE